MSGRDEQGSLASRGDRARKLTPRPVVFLDIDGVLCIAGSATATFDAGCVQALNWLTDTARADIVVSSTWRHMKSPVIDEKLNRGGVRGRVIGVTPDLSRGKVIDGHGKILWVGATRGSEIKAWLDKHGARPFVILDDDMDMDDLHEHHVLTTFREGLTPTLAGIAAAKIAQQQLDANEVSRAKRAPEILVRSRDDRTEGGMGNDLASPQGGSVPANGGGR